MDQKQNKHRSTAKSYPKVYLIGGGIASLSAAFFLTKDGKIPGKNITIFENSKKFGGSLDGEKESHKKAYLMRGHRILADKTFECTFEMLSQLPSLKNPKQNIKEEILKFNQKIKTHAKARLVEKGKVVDSHSLELSWKDRRNLLKLLLKTESSIQHLEIDDYFQPAFFKTNFWLEFCTVFAFQPWHSLVEFRRYLLRSFQALPLYDTMDCVLSTPYSQHDSIVTPLLRHLKKQKINFQGDCLIKDLIFSKNGRKFHVKKIRYHEGATEKTLSLRENDLVIITLGSMTANSSFGNNDKPPKLIKKHASPSWNLWEKISKKLPDAGNPRTFDNRISRSNWESFAITFESPLFFNLMEKLTKNKAGTGGGTTLKGSNWILSITLPHQPHFADQPEDVYVCWGYALSPNCKGNFVKKKMSACNGKEILEELCCHLGFEKHLQQIQNSAACVPCMLPYITSQFSLRKKTDRPLVRPRSVDNLAFTGQYCEIPHDISFTVEYSVRSAQMAVCSLLGIKKKIPPIYKGYLNLKNIFQAIKTSLR